MDFVCLTIIDPATGWFQLVELPVIIKKVMKKDKTIEEVVIDKQSAKVARLFTQQWLSCYPRANSITYDNRSEFKPH